MKTAVIFNSKSGSFNPAIMSKIDSMLFEYGFEPFFLFTKQGEQFNTYLESLKSHDFEAFIVCGGDGTIRAVAEVLSGTDIPLGVIPLGTANCLAREINLPMDPIKAANIICQKKTQYIDMGKIGDRGFLLMASAGFDAKVVVKINDNMQPMKDVFGSLAYIINGLTSLITYRPTTVTVSVDGELIETIAYLVVVSNAAKYGNGVNIAPMADISDGYLDVCIIKRQFSDNFGFLVHIGEIFANNLKYSEDVIYKKGKDIEIFSDPPIYTQIDGDPLGVTPTKISVVPGALRIFVP